MSKLPNFSNKEKAFLMYSAGSKSADIAKELDVTPNTVNTWKKDDDWDSKLLSEGSLIEDVTQQVSKLSVDGQPKVTELLADIVTDAIVVQGIRPTKWKDILDTIAVLTRGSPTSTGKSKIKMKDVTDVTDKDLDKEIAALNTLVNLDEDDADIVLYKNGEIKVQ